MSVVVQHLRTTTATKIPDGLAAGEVAFNLANGWMFVGVGGDDILVNGVAVSAYSSTLTILGKANIAVPAKPTGKGYEIFRLEDQPSHNTAVFSGADNAIQTTAGTGAAAKILTWLIANNANISAAADLSAGDTFVVTDGGAGVQTDVATGPYIWDGTQFVAMGGGSVPDATERTGTANTGTGGTKGLVYLARDIDVQETAAPGSTIPDPLAVATAAQLKALADRVSALATGHALLGTYDASTGKADSVTPAASADGRLLGTAVELGLATGLKAGDYLRVSVAGQAPTGLLTGPAAPLAPTTFTVGDQILFDGVIWHAFTTPPPPSNTLHGLSDVSDSAVATVAAADTKGILVRDSSVANNGDPDAYKLVDTLDCGTW